MATVTELIGVYHANGSVIGELSYFLKARLGRGHCALCDITHGTVREKAQWRDCREALSVPFHAVHLDERDPDVAAASEGHTPCVVARSEDGCHLLLGPDDLSALAGSPEALTSAIEQALREA